MKKIYRKDGVVKSRLILMASQMPELSHWPDKTKPFDVMESEVCRWFLAQPAMWEWLMQKMKDMGVIIFDKTAGKWVGCDTVRGRELIEAQASGPQ